MMRFRLGRSNEEVPKDSGNTPEDIGWKNEGLVERNLRLADRIPDPFGSADSTNRKKKRTLKLVSLVAHSALIWLSFAAILFEYHATHDDTTGDSDESKLQIKPQETSTETTSKSSHVYISDCRRSSVHSA
jgi:hypothetical protein